MRAGERWRKVPRLPWYYEISNLGRLRSLARVDRRGWYRKTKIIKYSNAETSLEGKWYPIAALVLEAFVGPKPLGCRLARHLNDDREDNRVENLAWGTDADNVNDAIKNGANFASYGRKGKPCAEETKQKLRLKMTGRKTGRKITSAHRAALLAGYRKKFPERRP